jgi:hypothetical protein
MIRRRHHEPVLPLHPLHHPDRGGSYAEAFIAAPRSPPPSWASASSWGRESRGSLRGRGHPVAGTRALAIFLNPSFGAAVGVWPPRCGFARCAPRGGHDDRGRVLRSTTSGSLAAGIGKAQERRRFDRGHADRTEVDVSFRKTATESSPRRHVSSHYYFAGSLGGLFLTVVMVILGSCSPPSRLPRGPHPAQQPISG